MNSFKFNNILSQKFNYLSIDFHGYELQELILRKITLEALIEINSNFNFQDDSEINNLINFISNETINKIESILGFKFPHNNEKDHWHLTTFFKKKTEISKSANNALRDFEKEKIASVDIISLIYIPNKILTLLCKPNCNVENKFPHITLLVKNVSPVLSNLLLETLFINENYLKKDYENIKKEYEESNSEVNNSVIGNENNNTKHLVLDNLDFNQEDCYFHKFDKGKYTLEGKMKFNF